MFVSMIGAFAQPVVLAMSLFASAESLPTVTLPDYSAAAPVAAVRDVEATKEELLEITAPGIQLSQYMSPAGRSAMCAALAKALGTSSASEAMTQALRNCYPGTPGSEPAKAAETPPASTVL